MRVLLLASSVLAASGMKIGWKTMKTISAWEYAGHFCFRGNAYGELEYWIKYHNEGPTVREGRGGPRSGIARPTRARHGAGAAGATRDAPAPSMRGRRVSSRAARARARRRRAPALSSERYDGGP